ncbi:hypothetical protein GQ44DRAFT_677512 [Phaeosphaeriaceae sp. PMI808]|nr:hypothetical protein GQ44DRAFT_677512 [Phaeosphaeriaceae sp. PMI808]
MSAPPSTHMPLFTSGPYLNLASSYISPASTVASDSSFTWAPMPPHQETFAQGNNFRTLAEPANQKPPNDVGLTFIIGSTPADFKSKETMTVVRKTAMNAFLKGGESDKSAKKGGSNKSTKKSKRPAVGSVDSDFKSSNISKQSVKSEGAATEFSTVPTTASLGAESVARTTASSWTRSSVQNVHEQDAPNAESSMVRVRMHPSPVPSESPHDSAPSDRQIVIPCRSDTPLPYDAHPPPLFISIGRSLDPFRTMFQSSHPGVSVEQLKYYCSTYFGTRALGRHWIPTALSYSHTFLGTLCLATAYHDVVNELPLESVQTVALRQEVIHLVGKNMLNAEEGVSDHNIMAVIQLIISEAIGREESGLGYHEDGIETMIKQRGGLNQLGKDSRLASAVSWVSLATAILREESPRTMYADYCVANSAINYHPTAMIPESPIFCPRSAFKTIMKSPKCTLKARELLDDIRIMIDIFLHETKQRRRNAPSLMNIYKKIINTSTYPPISELRNSSVLTENDYKYEAIRIVSIIQATAIIRRLPLSEAISVAAESQTPLTIYTSAIASRSNESLISPFDFSQETPLTASTSPSFSISPAIPQSYFPTTGPRSSISSVSSAYRPRPSFSSTFSAQRPSISSTHSSSEQIYFAPPPAPAPNHTTSLLKNLKEAIEHSNISMCWGDMAGVLLWIGLVVGAASRSNENKLLRKYYSALTMRAGVLLCFEHTEAINKTMLRMCEVVEALVSEKQSEETAGRSKKLRV